MAGSNPNTGAIEFPKMVFHPEQGSRVVKSQAEHDELGEEWLTNHDEARKLKQELDAEKSEGKGKGKGK